MKRDPSAVLRFLFVLGAVVDGAIAVSWFLIAAGFDVPNILNGQVGSGDDYRLAMYIGAMFMSGWTAILAWGAKRPTERKALLLITALFLTVSVLFEVVFYRDLLGGPLFVFGLSKRVVLSILFSGAYFLSFNGQGGQTTPAV